MKKLYLATLLAASFGANAQPFIEVAGQHYGGDANAVENQKLHLGAGVTDGNFVARGYFNTGFGADVGLVSHFENVNISAGLGVQTLYGDTTVATPVGGIFKKDSDTTNAIWVEAEHKNFFVRVSYMEYTFNFIAAPLDKKGKPVGVFTDSAEGSVYLVNLGYRFH